MGDKAEDRETALQLLGVFLRWNYSRWFLSNGLDKSLGVERSAHFFTVGYEEISSSDNWEKYYLRQASFRQGLIVEATIQDKPEDMRKFDNDEMAITFFLQRLKWLLEKVYKVREEYRLHNKLGPG